MMTCFLLSDREWEIHRESEDLHATVSLSLLSYVPSAHYLAFSGGLLARLEPVKKGYGDRERHLM
jgi:hypothetical protein